MSTAQLQHAVIKTLEGEKVEVKCLFNPKEYTFAKTNSWPKDAKAAAKFALSSEQLKALRNTVKDRVALVRARDAGTQVAYTLTRLNCIACHSRGGIGGPSPTRAAYFTSVGDADLGDEGRIPPFDGRTSTAARSTNGAWPT